MEKVDFSATFDTVSTWTFNYENHRHGIVELPLLELCKLVAAIIETRGQGLMPPTTEDMKNSKNMMNWLMSNKQYFTISQFIAILDLNSTVTSEFMSDIHRPVVVEKDDEAVDALRAQIAELEGKVQTFTQEANQISILEAQILKLRNEQIKAPPRSKTIPQSTTLSPSHKSIMQSRLRSNSFTNLLFNENTDPNQPCSPFVSSAPNPFAPPPTVGPSAPLVDENASVSSQLAQLTKLCTFLITKEATPPAPVKPVYTRPAPKINNNPELYSMAKHGTMREYAEDVFAMWARDNGMNEQESTLFFSKAFHKQIHRSHVNHIAKNADGSPRYLTIQPLISQVIKDLHLNQESEDDLQNKFNNYKICAKISMEEEFLRCFQYRKIGWPLESEAICIAHCKRKFILKLHGNSHLHTGVAYRQFLPLWIDATSYYDVTIQLREVENQYKGSVNQQSVGSHQPTKMDCNNVACIPCHATNVSNGKPIDQFTPTDYNSHDQNTQQMNNMSSKKCKNPNCGKPFTPSRPKYICCDMDCFKAFRASPEGKSSGGPYRKRASKKFNNMEHPVPQYQQNPPEPAARSSQPPPNPAPRLSQAQQHIPGMNNINNTNQNVSTTYITPAHLFSKNCNIPFIVKNSLYDTGASPTLMTFDTMKKSGLANLFVPGRTKGTLGGDQTPMKGYRGHVDIKMAVEDSIGYITDSCSKRVLIFDLLNHDFIVGQDFMRIGTRQTSLYPTLGKVLINPTNRMTKKFNQLVNEQIRLKKSFNNVSSPSNMFSDDSTFYLNVPCTTFNNVAMERYEGLVSLFTTKFMEKAEQVGSENDEQSRVNQVNAVVDGLPPENSTKRTVFEDDSPLANVLTEGGLDGLLDPRNIKVSDTKSFETSKGKVTVGSQLSPKMTEKFKNYVENHKGNVFDSKTLGKTVQTCHPTLKDDAKPFTATPKYLPLNTFMQGEAKGLVDKMVDLGVLIECTDTANSTIFIVQKSSGKWRLICDLRKYNERLADYVVHLPSPFELINKICQFELFSYCDFPDAYFNIPMSEESIKSNPIVASVSGQQKNYKFLRMAQGLRPATAMFVNTLNEIYAPIMDFTFNYLDDSVIGSDKDEEVHFTRLIKFVDLTQNAGLKLSLSKSVFFATDLTFLNYTVSNKSWALSDNQRATINALNADNLTKQKRESIAAFVQHFNKFHTGVAHASRKIRDVSVSADSVKSVLENIKKRLISSPALSSVNFKDDLHIYTDASSFDCSGVILQKTEHGMELVSCFSRKFPPSVACKCIYEKELWTLHQVTKTFRYLFLGPHKKIFHQDNRAVLAAQKSKAPSLNCLFNTIESTFTNVTFKFTSTDKNASDCFTRIDAVNSVSPKMPQNLADKIMKIHCNAGCSSADRILLTFQTFEKNCLLKLKDIQEVLQKCTVCQDIRNHKKPRKSSPGITVAREVTCQETIFIDHKQVINKARTSAITNNHQTDFAQDNFVLSSDKQSCLTVFEPVSKLVWIFPVKTYSTDNVKIALRTWFQQHGPPKNVVSDNALSFKALGSWLESQYNSKLHCTSAYHPNSNLSERAHKEFEKVVKIYDSETQGYMFENWEDTLSRACVAMNSLRHELHKMSAYEISKNRIQNDVDPISFYPVGLEHRVNFERFAEKAEKIFKSKLKIKLPVFLKGQTVKIEFPKQLARFATITSTKDHCYKMSVQCKFGKEKPISVNKNFICLPRFSEAANSETAVNPALTSTEIATEPTTEVISPSVPLSEELFFPDPNPETAEESPFIQFPEVTVNLPQAEEVVDARTARRNRRQQT